MSDLGELRYLRSEIEFDADSWTGPEKMLVDSMYRTIRNDINRMIARVDEARKKRIRNGTQGQIWTRSRTTEDNKQHVKKKEMMKAKERGYTDDERII